MARSVVVTVRLRRDARLVDGGIALPSGTVPVPALGTEVPAVLGEALGAALAALAAGDTTEVALGAEVTARAGMTGLVRWQLLLRRLDAGGLLEHAVAVNGREVARLRPVGRAPVQRGGGRVTGAVKLSRFAAVRAERGALVASHPRSGAVVDLRADVLGALVDWCDAEMSGTSGAATFGAVAGLPDRAAGAVLDLLRAADLLVVRPSTVDPGTDPDPEEDERHAGWAPHDLWLHARSRGGRLSARYGGSYPLKGRFPALPAVPAPGGGVRVRPAVPDLAVAAKTDPSLTEVLEQRRSIRRHHADRPIDVDRLGELLYRAARVRRTAPGGDGQEVVDRPYPVGGSLGELELYPLVTECAGLPAGLWHYASADHEFERVAEPGPATRALVAAARSASMMPVDPQVVLVVAARFGRVSWKYETIAYALTLKHVGVLYQTLYLVGTAMGLAVCGLGGGDAGDFATATGLDYLTEGSVGELVIGSAPPDSAHPDSAP